MLAIKSLILAAGLGTRLRPITNTMPKCLVEIGGEPILNRWLRELEAISCKETYINTHYFAEQVDQYIEQRQKTAMEIRTLYEKNLLGTAGTLLKNQSQFMDCTTVLIHCDNATNIDLGKVLADHIQRPKECCITMVTFNSDNPSSCGIVKTDENNIVRSFYEKVKNPPGFQANGAIYVFDPPFFDILNELEGEISDFSTEVLPTLMGRIYTHHTQDPFIDIGTQDRLEAARKLWQQPTDSSE